MLVLGFNWFITMFFILQCLIIFFIRKNYFFFETPISLYLLKNKPVFRCLFFNIQNKFYLFYLLSSLLLFFWGLYLLFNFQPNSTIYSLNLNGGNFFSAPEVFTFLSGYFLLGNYYEFIPDYMAYLTVLPFKEFLYTIFFNLFYIDGLSLFFVLLTTLLFPLSFIFLWNNNEITSIKTYLFWLLFLEIILILVFSTVDLFIFYIFFEIILIPMVLIIGFWGSRSRKIKAANYFFLYTFLGSLFMLLGIVIIYLTFGTTNYFILLTQNISFNKQLVLWLLFFLGFAIKIPMFPFHIWLPEAHVEAPTVGSVILAGILLKLGSYGFLRFSIPLFPLATVYFLPLIYTLSIVGIIYSSITVLRQIDMKRIIAYSSIAHMNFLLLGLFSLTIEGFEGSYILMISHGLISSALFFCIGVLYNRYHTRIIYYFSGLVRIMPQFVVFFFLFNIANFSFPGTSNFIGEFLIFLGLIQKNLFLFLLTFLGIVLSAVYSLLLVNRICFGTVNSENLINSIDLLKREKFILLILLLFTFIIGLYPNFILVYIKSDIFFLYSFFL